MAETNFQLKIAKLVNFQKLPDRNFVADVYLPKNPEEKKLGTMLVLIEILSPWFPAADAGKLIFETATANYYNSKTEYEDNQQRLEESLKEVNKKLAELANRGEVEWLGNLNAICAIVYDNTLLLSQTGNADAYLFRGNSFSHITEGLKVKETPHPIKTFANLTSGSINDGDKILLTTDQLFAGTPFQDIRQTITNHESLAATEQIKKTLLTHKNNRVNLLLFETHKTETNQPTQIETVELDEKKEGWLNKTAKLVRPVMNTADDTLTETEIAEKIKKGKKTAFGRKFFVSVGKSAIKIGDRVSGNFRKKSRRELVRDKISAGKIDTNLYQDSKGDKAKGSFFQKIFSAAKSVVLGLITLISSPFQPKKNRFVFIVTILILVTALIFGISVLRKSQARRESEMNARALLTEAENKIKQGDEQLSLNQEPNAKKLYLEGIELGRRAAEHLKVEEDANKFIASVQVKIDKIDNIVRVTNPTQLVDLGSQNKTQPLGFCIINNDIYTASPSTGQLTKYSAAASETSNLGTPGIIQEPKFVICGIEDLFAYTKAKHVFRYSLEGQSSVVGSGQSAEWVEATSGRFFADNIYLLDTTAGQIWKFRPEGENFSAPVEYLNAAQVDIKNAKAMTVDGYVYVATRTNKIIKMLSGAVQADFKLKDLPTPDNKIEDAVDIFTTADLNFIYILDNEKHRLVEFDKEGLYTQQWVFPDNLSALKKAVISQKDRKIYLMNGSTVYEVGM